MKSKKSKQIVTGILAVILIITMLIGVVSPVFAVEDSKVEKEALFNDYDSLFSVIKKDDSGNYYVSLSELFVDFLSGKQDMFGYLLLKDNIRSYKFVIGYNEKYFPVIEVKDEDYIDYKVADVSSNSLNDAINKAVVAKEDDSGRFIQFSCNPEGLSSLNEYEEFLSIYTLYVISDSNVKYSIPICDLMNWVIVNDDDIIKNETESEVDKITELVTEVDTIESNVDESSNINEIVESDINVEQSDSVSSVEDFTNVDDSVDTSGKLFTSVDLSLVSSDESGYVLHVNIDLKDGDIPVDGYCSGSGMYLANMEVTETSFDFSVQKGDFASVYYLLNLADGSSVLSNVVSLNENSDDLSLNVGNSLKTGSFEVKFTGLPDSAIKGESIKFKMITSVPCYMKFNGASIGRNTLGTEFEVIVSGNGNYSYEAINENNEVVRGEYNINIFMEDDDSSVNVIGIVVLILFVVLVVIVFIVVRGRKKNETKVNEDELTEEDL